MREINTYVDISNQLLADSSGVAEAEVRMALAEDFGQKEGLWASKALPSSSTPARSHRPATSRRSAMLAFEVIAALFIGDADGAAA
ncbi:MAG: hypothetical protein AB7O60_15280 [Variibacter sp.]